MDRKAKNQLDIDLTVSGDCCKLSGLDLIRRQDAIDVCMKYNGQGRIWSCIMGDIEKLPSAQQWIPVKERLPEVGEVVLLTIHEIGWNGCEYDSVVSGVYSSNKNHILAWMPLPEPYKPQESEDKE